MARWVREPDKLTKGELITRALAANHQVGWRAVGGRLFVTNERLIFEPNAVDRRSGGGRWECRLYQFGQSKLTDDQAPCGGRC